MPDIWLDVDIALSEVPVNVVPLVDTAGTTIDAGVTYDEAGMDLNWNFITTAGAYSQTNVSPTTGGTHDWASLGNGIYSIEIPASGGTINNDTEGFGWFSGFCTACLPWRGPVIGFRKASMNNVMIDSGTIQDNLENMYDGTGYAGGTIRLQSDLTHILSHLLADTGTQLADGFQTFFDVGAPTTMLAQTGVSLHGDYDAAKTAAPASEYDTEMARITADVATEAKQDIIDTAVDSILAMLDDARGEPGDTAPPVNPDAMTKLDYLYKFMRNKIETTPTKIHVYNDAESNKDHTSDIEDSGTTFTRGEFGAGD